MNAITRRRSLMAVQGGEPPVPPYDPIYDNYLVFEVVSSGTITWKVSTNSTKVTPRTIYYSLDDGVNWTSLKATYSGAVINVAAGDIVCFKGSYSAYAAPYNSITKTPEYYHRFGGTAGVVIGGTLNAMLEGYTMGTYAFNYFFYQYSNMNISSVHPLVMPSIVKNYCYNWMFASCTSLTRAPELPVATLVNYCYNHMFGECSNLAYVKCLATNITATSCVGTWLNGVAATGTFIKDTNMTSWTTGTSGIPSGWTVQNA